MASERTQRRIESLLDEAEEAIARLDWQVVNSRAQAVIALDPGNPDAINYLAAAERASAESDPQPTSQSAAPTPAAEASTTDHPGSFADRRYQVQRFLGEGGKKKVYLAHDTLLDREVAFALIKTEGLDETSRTRIQREAQAMGRLGSHPHIVTVFDLGQEGDQPYMVTELMAGGDVQGAIEQAPERRVELGQAVGVAIETCRGLEFAHQRGIVHRDLKPGNVWLTADGVAKIGDFGLAVALDRSRLTAEAMMVGTVAYMPPEQALGGEVTPQSDLYSLGAMLYELVCGRPPFVGDESVAIITQHLNTPPVAPSWHRPDIPAALEAMILRLLEKDQDKRPGSATEVREALAAIDLEGPVSADGVGEAGTVVDSPLYRHTFVGREQELQQLQKAFDAALSGQGSLASVVGEPGIGKTALCEQLATYAAVRGGRALVGHCYEEGSLSLPYLPFVEALRSYVLNREPEDLARDLGTGAAEVARIVSEVRERVQVEPRPSSDPEDDRWRLYQAVTGFLRNAAEVQPVLLILEDLHWADQGTLDYLVHLSRNLSGTRLLLVATYRDVEVDRTHLLSSALAELSRGPAFGRVQLRGLDTSEVQHMLSALAGQEAPWSLAEAVYRQTEGNPLFTQEVVRYLVEEGLLGRNRGPENLTAAGTQPLNMRIPEGLRDVIGKRLSRLSPECNRMMGVASVIGRDFDLQTLLTIAGLDEDTLETALEEAVKVGVLEEQARPGVIHYRFAHAFFRQTLYEEMIAHRRLRLHQQVARALEGQYQARPEEHAAELAEHFAQSTDPADLTKATHYGRMAAQRSLGVYAYGEAVRHLERSLQVPEISDPEDKDTRCDLLLALGEAMLPAGEPLRAAREVAPLALSLAEELDDAGRAGRACLMAVFGLRRYGAATLMGTPEGQGWAQELDRYAAPGTAARVHADLALAAVQRMAGRLSEARQGVTRALALARDIKEPDALFYAAYQLLVAQWGPKHLDEEFDLAQEVLTWPTQATTPRTAALALFFSGVSHFAHGDRDTAEELWDRMAELAERTREPTAILRIFSPKMARATTDGRLEAAVELGVQLVTRAEEMGSAALGRGYALHGTFRPLLYLGRGQEALTALETFLALTSSARGEALRPLCLAYLGRQAEALEDLRSVMADVGIGGDVNETPTRALISLLETAVLVGDRESALHTRRRLDALDFPAYVDGVIPTCLARHLGAAAALLGEEDEARALYQQALEVCEKLRFRPEIALTRLQLAELLLEQGAEERNEAQEHLDFAIAEFQAMKMQPALERALGHKEILNA